MTVNITDVDAFTDPVVAPADADAATGASVQQPVQGLANRTRNHKNRIDAIDVVNGSFGSFALSGTPSASALVTLAESFDPQSVFSVASNQITVSATGYYMGMIVGNMNSADATNPLQMQLQPQYNSLPITTVGGYRYSASNLSVYFSGAFIFEVTNVAHLIDVVNSSSVAVTVNAGARLFLRRLS